MDVVVLMVPLNTAGQPFSNELVLTVDFLSLPVEIRTVENNLPF